MTEQVAYGSQTSTEANQLLTTFWQRMMNDIRSKPLLTAKIGNKKDETINELPLARIKKIMKQDGEVKMISAEAPILFSKAAEIFISELSLRAWIHTEDNKRRTLQRNDIAMAITKYDQFDFLIDIVPRDELKPAKRQDEELMRQQPNVMAPEQVQYYFQLSQLQQQQSGNTAAPSSATTPHIAQLPPGAHIIQQPNGQVIIAATQPHQIAALANASSNNQQTQIVQIPSQTNSTAATAVATAGSTTEVSQVSSQTEQLSQETTGHTSSPFGAAGQQLQYIRIPQSALQQANGNMTQVIQLQQQIQQQLQQHQQQQQQQQNSQQTSSEQQSSGNDSISQVYQPIQGSGLPAGTVYVMAPATSQVNEEEAQQRD